MHWRLAAIPPGCRSPRRGAMSSPPPFGTAMAPTTSRASYASTLITERRRSTTHGSRRSIGGPPRRARRVGHDLSFKSEFDQEAMGAMPHRISHPHIDPEIQMNSTRPRMSPLLHNGDSFPELTVQALGGLRLSLPGELAGSFGVV